MRLKWFDDEKVDGKQTEWKRGRTKLTINDGGMTDLGEIKIAAAEFK